MTIRTLDDEGGGVGGGVGGAASASGL